MASEKECLIKTDAKFLHAAEQREEHVYLIDDAL